MRVRTIAPAKINWTLEVLGKRPDGYHEVRTVLQTVDLCDEVTLQASDGLLLDASGDHSPSDDDHTLQAARLLGKVMGRNLCAAIHVDKRIPVAAGLGGGSSDAGAVLRGLRALHGLEITNAQLLAVAAGVGSDAPFFLRGGTALGTGRGEQITPLPDAPEAWFVLLVPPISLADKTRRMYAALEASDFTDGRRTEEVAAAIRRGEPVEVECLFNAFDSAARRMFPELEAYRQALREASGGAVHMAGAGPALLALQASSEAAQRVAARLRRESGRVFVTRTLTAVEAARIEG